MHVSIRWRESRPQNPVKRIEAGGSLATVVNSGQQKVTGARIFRPQGKRRQGRTKSLEPAVLSVATTTWLVGSLPLDLNLRVQLSPKKPQRPKPAKRAHRQVGDKLRNSLTTGHGKQYPCHACGSQDTFESLWQSLFRTATTEGHNGDGSGEFDGGPSPC